MFIASDLLVISVWEFPKQIHRQTEYGPKKELPAVLSFVILGKTFSFLGKVLIAQTPFCAKHRFAQNPTFVFLEINKKFNLTDTIQQNSSSK